MLKISGTEIKLTRGDSASLSISITDASGNAYEVQDGDTVTFTVKKRATDKTALIQKASIGSAAFAISPADTSALSFGQYLYDVQLDTAEGNVYTVIEPSTFEVCKEVTW